MFTRRFSWTTATCCIALLASHSLAGPPAGKGKGGKNKPPPVTYEIDYLGDPFSIGIDGDYSVRDMNHWGDVAGYIRYDSGDYAAFLYTPDSGFVDLNSFPEMDEWAALGWTAAAALGVNDQGQMVVLMLLDDGTKGLFRYDPADTNADSPTPSSFQFIETVGVLGGTGTRAAINDFGNIAYNDADDEEASSWRLFTDDYGIEIPTIEGSPIAGAPTGINNGQEIVGSYGYTMFRYSADTGNYLSIDNAYSNSGDINDSGDFCFTVVASKGNGPPSFDPARYVEATGQTEIVRGAGHGVDINAAGDVAVSSSGYVFVCPDSGGQIEIDDSNVVGEPDLVSLWQDRYGIWSVEMNDAVGTSDFGQLSGVISVRDEAGNLRDLVYLLTPVPTAQ